MSPQANDIPDLDLSVPAYSEGDEPDEAPVLPPVEGNSAVPELSSEVLEAMLTVATDPATPEPEGDLIPHDTDSTVETVSEFDAESSAYEAEELNDLDDLSVEAGSGPEETADDLGLADVDEFSNSSNDTIL